MTLTFSVRKPLYSASTSSGSKRGKGWSAFTVLLYLQGTYFFLTGVWPLLSMETFLMVTGPKTDHLVTGLIADHWLVKTVGVLVTAIGLTLLVAAYRQEKPLEAAILAMVSSLGLACIDVVYVMRGVIDPIYLLDAAVEVVLLGTWATILLRENQQEEDQGSDQAGRHAA